MYSHTEPTVNLDLVDSHRLSLENGLRANDAPAHAIRDLYTEGSEPVIILAPLTPFKPLFRPPRVPPTPKRSSVTVVME